MSVLFNHVCLYELFDRNSIHLVHLGSEWHGCTNVLTPDDDKRLIDEPSIAERTLVLLAALTGIAQER